MMAWAPFPSSELKVGSKFSKDSAFGIVDIVNQLYEMEGSSCGKVKELIEYLYSKII